MIQLHLLFVCTGNICRSPTAERLTSAQSDQLTTSSAGLRAVIGYPIHPEASLVLKRLGGDDAGFAARQLTSKIAMGADLILTMTRAHRDAVLELAPRQLRKTFTLTEAARLVTEFGAEQVTELAALRPQLSANELLDIRDPIGQSSHVFETVGVRIDELLKPVIRLCERSCTT